MPVGYLSAESFRNLSSERFELDPGVNLVVGDNGQGKTNLLEALALVSGRPSFRTADLLALRRDGSESCRLVANLHPAAGKGPEGLLAATLGAESREHLFDGRRVTRLSAATLLPAVFLTAADLGRLTGAPADRRRALDRVAVVLTPSHADSLRRYEKARASKTRLLASKAARRDERRSFDDLLVESGLALAKARREAARALGEALEREARTLGSPHPELALSVISNPQLGDEPEAAFRRALASRWSEETHAGRCLVGPHRDDVVLTSRGKPVAPRVSSGENRTLVLAWTLAELRVVGAARETSPLLAFDDFDSEWDLGVLRSFAESLRPGVQTLLTSAREGSVSDLPLPSGRLFRMVRGRLSGEGILRGGRRARPAGEALVASPGGVAP